MANHFTLTIFWAAKGAMYGVAIATVIFSHVKIKSCFRTKAHLVFHWYLYNKTCYFYGHCQHCIQNYADLRYFIYATLPKSI